MTKRLDLYRCELCGNLVQVILNGEGELVCCGEPMRLVQGENDVKLQEKHVPVFKFENGKDIVQVGTVLHPMTAEHQIMFIETISKDNKKLQLEYLSPNDKPEMILEHKLDKTKAIEFCNIHGLWEGESR